MLCVPVDVMPVHVQRSSSSVPALHVSTALELSLSKQKAKVMVFTAKRRKDLAVDLAKTDYADVMDSAIAMLQRGVHYPARAVGSKF